MRLLEAIVDANHRAAAGDASAGLRPAEFESDLPLAALTCIDARLNALLPQALGVPPSQFIWLRNAGNIITGPLSSTMRSLALACAVEGGKEVVVIGHTNCLESKTSTLQLLDKLRALGVERHRLPDNVNEFFGAFASESQNVIKAAGIVRGSPLIGLKIPVHGLLIDIETGRLEWLVNGYQALEIPATPWQQAGQSAGQALDALKPLADFKLGEMKLPDTQIGELAGQAEDWIERRVQELKVQPAPPVQPAPAAAPPAPPKLPLPPPIRPKMRLNRPG